MVRVRVRGCVYVCVCSRHFVTLCDLLLKCVEVTQQRDVRHRQLVKRSPLGCVVLTFGWESVEESRVRRQSFLSKRGQEPEVELVTTRVNEGALLRSNRGGVRH